jgi:DNA-binding PadR family transcriptional regulator
LFVLDAFERHGEMHGYQLRQQAERERVARWTDISVGAIYGALRRLVGDGLLDVVRTEQDGNRPERQVFAISAAGRATLAELRHTEARTVVVRADPFDLAFTRPDPDRLDEHEATIEARLTTLRRLLAERVEFSRRAAPFLTLAETRVLTHREALLRADIDWHEHLLADLPAIIADERSGPPHPPEGAAP